tara:strand:+ start:1037 stop:1276 length:240 start_codon:yes stop_codon:yes gene_type:complete
LFLDQNLENGLVFTRNERARLKNAILKNITVKADKLANEYNKTKDPGIKDQWYATIKEAAKHAPEEEEEGNRINFKRKN